jgi:hypothetical protein
MSPAVTTWLARAVADAKARDLPQLEPLLEALARSLQALRDADSEFVHPALPSADPNPRSPIPNPRSPIPGPRSPIPDPRSPDPGPRSPIPDPR